MPEPRGKESEDAEEIPTTKVTEASHVSTDSPVLAAFRIFAKELDAKHDRHERIVKLSRDITIESKRIIFFLHSLSKMEDRSAGLASAEKRLLAIASGALSRAASEMQGRCTPSSLSPGMQEMVEAACFLHHLKHSEDSLPALTYLQDVVKSNKSTEGVTLRASPLEFMLGVTDYTGEMMRLCINSLSDGDTSQCFLIRTLLQKLYTNFLSLDMSCHWEMDRKMHTMHQSVLKVEAACCDLKLRGRHKSAFRKLH